MGTGEDGSLFEHCHEDISQSYKYLIAGNNQQSMDPITTKKSSNTGTIIILGLGALALIWTVFRNRNTQTKTSFAKNDSLIINCIAQMKQMREVISKGQITLEDCRKSLWLVFNYTMEKVNQHNRVMKKKRKGLDKMEQYLQTLIEGIEEGKVVVAKAKVQAHHRMAITDATFVPFQRQIPIFKKQFKKEYMEKNKDKELSYGEIQHLLDIQIQYFQNNGKQLATKIILSTQPWPNQKKEYLKYVIPLIIIDKAFQGFSDIDETQFESAKRKYREQLSEELKRLSEVSQDFTNIIKGHLLDQ